MNNPRVQHTEDQRGESWHVTLPNDEAVRVVRSAYRGVWRGLHWSDRGPIKTITLMRGDAFGVLLHPENQTWETFRFDRWPAVVGIGWAWGWLALATDTVVVYHFDRPLGREQVIYWNDRRLWDVPWPIKPTIMSERDTPT